MRLCLRWGVPQGELAERLSAAELSELMALSRLEPWGEAVEDLRVGLLASIILNLFRKPHEQLTPLDCCPDYEGTRKRNKGVDLSEMTPAEVREAARTMAEALGAGENGEGSFKGPTIA